MIQVHPKRRRLMGGGSSALRATRRRGLLNQPKGGATCQRHTAISAIIVPVNVLPLGNSRRRRDRRAIDGKCCAGRRSRQHEQCSSPTPMPGEALATSRLVPAAAKHYVLIRARRRVTISADDDRQSREVKADAATPQVRLLPAAISSIATVAQWQSSGRSISPYAAGSIPAGGILNNSGGDQCQQWARLNTRSPHLQLSQGCSFPLAENPRGSGTASTNGVGERADESPTSFTGGGVQCPDEAGPGRRRAAICPEEKAAHPGHDVNAVPGRRAAA